MRKQFYSYPNSLGNLNFELFNLASMPGYISVHCVSKPRPTPDLQITL